MFSIGISDLICPVHIPEKNGGMQQTIATIHLQAQGPAAQTPWSVATMADLLATHLPELHSGIFPGLLQAVQEKLAATSVLLQMHFPYFIEKKAPVSATPSLMEYRCAFSADSAHQGEPALTVAVPVTTLCPCSREISEYGAHNQRAAVTLTVRPRGMVWLEDLIALAEGCGSGEVYALLKRPDEKYLTEWAYSHPMFVEDVARKVAQTLAARADIAWFSVGVESFESIHAHSAFAQVDSDSMA